MTTLIYYFKGGLLIRTIFYVLIPYVGRINMEIIPQLLVNGIVIGSYYVLIALGLSIIFGVLEIPHFAHGSIAMFSGYIAYIMIGSYSSNLIIAVLVSIIFAVIIGVVIERIAYRPVAEAPPINSFIIALALMIFIDNLAAVLFGPNQVVIRLESNKIFHIGSVSISENRLYLIVVTLLLVSILYLFVKYTKTGKAIRAVSQNKNAAKLVGINTNRISSIVFGVGSALGGAAGAFMGILFALYPSMGGTTVIKGFAVIILGGLGSFPGAIIGGLLIGMTENLGVLLLSSTYKDLFAFVILIAVLIFKPSGLFGDRGL